MDTAKTKLLSLLHIAKNQTAQIHTGYIPLRLTGASGVFFQ
jgi:hypothetical protein